LIRNWLQLDLYTPWIPSLLRDVRSQGFDTKMVDNWSEASSRLWAFTIVGYSHRISSCAYSGMESLFFFPNFLFMVSSFRTRQTRITTLKITELHMLTMLLFLLHQLIRLSQPHGVQLWLVSLHILLWIFYSNLMVIGDLFHCTTEVTERWNI
jgi:hypothetical protein